MKMGKVKSKVKQSPSDFSKYKVVDDYDGVNKLKSYIVNVFNISGKQIDFDGLRNVEVAKPFFER